MLDVLGLLLSLITCPMNLPVILTMSHTDPELFLYKRPSYPLVHQLLLRRAIFPQCPKLLVLHLGFHLLNWRPKLQPSGCGASKILHSPTPPTLFRQLRKNGFLLVLCQWFLIG